MFKEDMKSAMLQGGIGQEYVGTSSMAQQEREIPQAVNALRNEISDLTNVLQTLGKRLETVIQSREEPKGNPEKSPDPCYMTHMGSKLFVEFDRVRDARRFVEGLLDRLEL